MIVVRCPVDDCKGEDTLILTEKYGGLPVMFYCEKHNQCLHIEDVIFVKVSKSVRNK